MEHQSVLLAESIEGLAIKPNGVYVDGTLGRGGHSQAILERLDQGHLYAFDKDEKAIEESKQRLMEKNELVTFIQSDFAQMRTILEADGVKGIDGLLLDLGVSSPQFDDPQRGFSYRYDARLDMRMDMNQDLDAYQVVNTYSYEALANILARYGEEKYAKQIARQIEKQRQPKPIETTVELVEVVKAALPQRALHEKGHPAKKTFQAIRIEVNHELESLETVLTEMIPFLNEHGRICVISFHSLEDRIVKNIFNAYIKPAEVDKRIPLLPEQLPKSEFAWVNKKPIVASEAERNANNRAHSAKLRIMERSERNES